MAAATDPYLWRLFEAAGYRVEEGPFGVRATRRSDRRTILIVKGNGAPADLASEFPTDSIHRTLLYVEDPGAAARTQAAESGLEILDATTIGPALGELLLAPAGPSAGDTGLTPPRSAVGDTERVVRPRFDRRDAESLAGLEGFRCTLRLVPYLVAAYRVRVPAPHGGSGEIADHLVAVNGLTGQVESWERGDRELVPDIAEPHQTLDPIVSPERARELAERFILARHAVNVDHTEQHDGALVIERRRLSPSARDLSLGETRLVHVPLWYVEGPEGRVVLDAVTGERRAPADARVLPEALR
jgi:hypothetical protein